VGKGKGKGEGTGKVVQAPRHEDVLGSRGIDPRIFYLGTRERSGGTR